MSDTLAPRGAAAMELRDERATEHTLVQLSLVEGLPVLRALVFDKARRLPIESGCQ